MFDIIGMKLLYNVFESFVDNVCRDRVVPIRGSVVYCELSAFAEHSGIFIGNNKIVHLNGSGDIESVSPRTFINRLDGFNTAMSIYVSCNGTSPVGNFAIAERAEEMVGKRRDYHVLFDNCHQFTSGCMTGDFENNNKLFCGLKSIAKVELEANTWRVWEREEDGAYYEDPLDRIR